MPKQEAFKAEVGRLLWKNPTTSFVDRAFPKFLDKNSVFVNFANKNVVFVNFRRKKRCICKCC